jgi:5-methylcytosine-specific restriction endonuclease McrA
MPYKFGINDEKRISKNEKQRERDRKKLRTLNGKYKAWLSDNIHTRKIAVRVGIEEYARLITSNCYYCNEPSGMSLEELRAANGSEDLRTVGIDRKDSSGIYERSNIVPACWTCNRSKGELTEEQFANKIIAQYEYYASKRQSRNSDIGMPEIRQTSLA